MKRKKIKPGTFESHHVCPTYYVSGRARPNKLIGVPLKTLIANRPGLDTKPNEHNNVPFVENNTHTCVA